MEFGNLSEALGQKSALDLASAAAHWSITPLASKSEQIDPLAFGSPLIAGKAALLTFPNRN